MILVTGLAVVQMGVVCLEVATSSGQQVFPGADESAFVADEVNSLLAVPARLGVVEGELLQRSPDQWRVSLVHDLLEFSFVLKFATLQRRLVKVLQTITRKFRLTSFNSCTAFMHCSRKYVNEKRNIKLNTTRFRKKHRILM